MLRFAGRGLVPDIINLGTFGIPRYHSSHVAIVGPWSAEHGGYLVYESTSFARAKCLLSGRAVKGLQVHTLKQLLATDNSRIWVGRLVCPLYEHETQRLTATLNEMLARPYDMLGAFRSGGFLFNRIMSLIHPDTLDAVFCSELVAYSLAAIGRFRTDSFGRWNPNSLCRALRRNKAIHKWERVK